MMIQMIGSFAKFEHAMISERMRAGLEQARIEGRIGGRRPELGPRQRAKIVEVVMSGRMSAAEWLGCAASANQLLVACSPQCVREAM